MAPVYRSSTPEIGGAVQDWDALIGNENLRVVIVDFKREVETEESFAIKFSILTKVPLPKAKQIAHKLPFVVWKGKGRSKAERILSLIEEAGGKGVIEVELDETPQVQQAEQSKPPEQNVCAYCKFPLKEGETYCSFCMTPVSKSTGHERHTSKPTRKPAVPRARLVVYICVLVAGIAVLIYQHL